MREIQVRVDGPCVLWEGSTSETGYGREYIGQRDGKNVYRQAHRMAYERAHGPIPEGLVIDHLCRERGCVNPDHLEAVTQAENVRRGLATRQPGESVCANGHALTPENTYRPVGTNQTKCRECRREVNRRRRSRATKEVHA